MQIEESFSLKGSREYVQGTTIFNAFVSAAQEMGHAQGSIDITFKKMVSNPDCLIQVRASHSEDSSVALVVGADGSKATLCLVSAAAQGQVNRVEYDEDVVCAGARIDGCSVTVRRAVHPDDIELLIALCKKLHQAYFATDKKWLFSRYKGRFPLELSDDVKISIVKNIGVKLTCSDVFSAGTKVGEIFFS